MAFRPSNYYFNPLNETNLHASTSTHGTQAMDNDRNTRTSSAAAGRVLVRVEAVGICGTDYSGYLGKCVL